MQCLALCSNTVRRDSHDDGVFSDPVLQTQSWAHPAGVRVHHAVGSWSEGADTLRYDAPLIL